MRLKGLILTVSILFISSVLAVSQPFNERMELVNLGRDVNTGYHEAGPVISPDGNTLYFFVHNHPDNTYGKEGSQDVWFVTKNADGSWSKAMHMDKPINVHRSNQVFAVLNHGNTLFVRGGRSRNSKGFSFYHKQGASWGNEQEVDVENFKKMNNGKYYGATMTADAGAMVLYFSERDKATFSDLYISKRQEDGSYSRPVKIESLNTGRDEFAPYLAPDGKTLYFSSSRKDMGEGSADIYVSRRLDETWLKWSEPVNLGRPVNTRAFDAYLCVDNDDNIYVTQSGRTIDGGNLDIFTLEPRAINITLKGMVMDAKTKDAVHGEIRLKNAGNEIDTLQTDLTSGTYATSVSPKQEFMAEVVADGYQPLTTTVTIGDIQRDSVIFRDFSLVPNEKAVMLTGIIYNSETLDPLSGSVWITDQGKEIQIRTNNKGYYEKEVKSEGWLNVTGSAEGFINAADSIMNDRNETLLVVDLYLEPIAIGTTVRLDNIFFDFDKTSLKPESYKELNKVVDFLESNASVSIEIAGHTDSKGSDEYNNNLSQGRAQAVVDYLYSQGIDDNRIQAHGYGESVPVATNNTDDGRAMNRRVEFTILSIN